MAIIPDFYLNAVASIGVNSSHGIAWIGTGFFVQKQVKENQYLVFFVTNKHVLGGHESVLIRMKKKGASELQTVVLALESGKTYFENPDERVDIAAIQLHGGVIEKNNLEFSAFDVDEHILTSSELKERGLSEGSSVFMLGYPLPMRLVNSESNAPICRAGCVARFDLNEISKSKNILLDVLNFPGNSGSPIISKPEIVSIEGTPALNQSLLVGVVHSYIEYQDNIVSSQTGRVVEVRTENSGIANANPAEYIRETITPAVEAYTKILSASTISPEKPEETT